MPATVISSGHLKRWSTVSNLTHFLWISNESNSFSCDFYFSNFLSNIKGSCDVGTIKGSISNNCIWKSQLRPSCLFTLVSFHFKETSLLSVHPCQLSHFRSRLLACRYKTLQLHITGIHQAGGSCGKKIIRE